MRIFLFFILFYFLNIVAIGVESFAENSKLDYQGIRDNLRSLDSRLDKLIHAIDDANNSSRKTTNLKNPPPNVARQNTNKSFSTQRTNPSKGKGWNLLVLRELALEHSPDLLIKKADTKEFEKEISVLRFSYYPTANGKVSYNDYVKISQFETYSEPEPYKTFSYGIDAKWVLYNGFKTRKQINVANLELEKSKLALIYEEQAVLKKLTNNFFNALSSQVKLNFLPKIESVINQKLSVYKKQLSSGVVDSLLVNNAVRDLENMRSQFLESKLSMELSKAEMNLILDTDDQFWSNQDKFIPPSDFQFNNKFESKDSVSEYLGQSGIEIAESKYELTESENSPVLELIGSTGHSSRDSLKFGSTGHEITLGLNVSIPISGRFLTRRKLSKARVAIEKAELLKHKLTKQQKNQFLTESFKLNQAEKTLKLQQELWRLQKERLDKIISMFSKRMSEKSVILMERETLLRREMFLELSRISYIKQKYILDLIQ